MRRTIYNEKEVVLDEFSLKLSAGERFALVGKSGCGKTTVNCFLSLLDLDRDNIMPWLAENYIEVVFNHNKGEHYLIMDFLDHVKIWWENPFINVSRINRSIPDNLEIDIVDFIKKCIDNEQYAMTIIDSYYIRQYKSYYKIHVPHEIFIYGYTENAFLAKDYFDFTIYAMKEVEFDEFREGFNRFSKVRDDDDYLRGLILFKRNHNVVTKNNLQYNESGIYLADKTLIKNRLDGFIYSSPYVLASCSNTYEPCKGFITGFKCFELMVKEIADSIAYDLIKPLSLLYNHIFMMGVRLQFLNDTKIINATSLINRNHELKVSMQVIRNSYIKQRIKHSIDIDGLKRSLIVLLSEYKTLLDEFSLLL